MFYREVSVFADVTDFHERTVVPRFWCPTHAVIAYPGHAALALQPPGCSQLEGAIGYRDGVQTRISRPFAIWAPAAK